MAWRLAKSLEVLRQQVNEAYPKRSKASDGTIGDQAHASGASDHNPNKDGIVCALDLTHDPANGFDAHALADTLITKRHTNLKYVISNSRIAGAWTNWRWVGYAGVNPHNKHIHISVGTGPDGRSAPPYDDENKWNIGGNDMSVMTFDLALKEADAQWGWGSRTPERDAILKRDIVGGETNERATFMYNHPWGVTWRQYRDKLQAFYNFWYPKVQAGELDKDDEQIKNAMAELEQAKANLAQADEELKKALED